MSKSLLPSLSYLLDCSEISLGESELSNLNLSVQCLKRAKAEIEEAIAHREAAGVLRWVIENRLLLLEEARNLIRAEMDQGVLVFPRPLAELPSGEGCKPVAELQSTPDTYAYLSKRRYSHR